MIYGGTHMAIIRPSADLRNHYKEISEICKSSKEPVYITVNGKEDTVLISSDSLNELKETIDLLSKINRSLQDIIDGRVTSLSDVKKRYGI